MMKKILALILSFVFVFALVSCDEDLPVINEDLYIDEDGGIHFPPIEYTPPAND